MCLLATAPSEFGAQMYSEHAQGLKGAPPDSLFSRFCLHALQFGTCNIRGTKKYHNFLALLLPMLIQVDIQVCITPMLCEGHPDVSIIVQQLQCCGLNLSEKCAGAGMKAFGCPGSM